MSKFLNRILGMPVELQNRLFKYFTDTLAAVMERGNICTSIYVIVAIACNISISYILKSDNFILAHRLSWASLESL